MKSQVCLCSISLKILFVYICVYGENLITFHKRFMSKTRKLQIVCFHFLAIMCHRLMQYLAR